MTGALHAIRSHGSDLFVANVGSGNEVHRNDNGVFTSVSLGSFTSMPHEPKIILLADIDGDGDLDIFVGQRNVAFSPTHNLIHRNDNGNFTLLTGTAVNSGMPAGTEGAAFADIDEDGDLDLVVANEGALTELYLFKHCSVGARFGTTDACVSVPSYARIGRQSDQSFECPEHMTCSATPTLCQECPPGFVRPLGSPACEKCLAGTYQPTELQHCRPADPGYYTPYAVTATACPISSPVTTHLSSPVVKS